MRRCLILIVICLFFAQAGRAGNEPEGKIRAPVAAGKFYSNSPARLKLAIEKFLQDAIPAKVKNPVAIIVPHAGFIYSGQICADGFKQVSNQKYDVIVVLGTNHTTPRFQKISLYPGADLRTPLGTVEVDRDLVLALQTADPDACSLDEALHEYEHSIEVIIPFIQVLFPQARIVPVVVGAPDVPLCKRFGQALAKTLKNKHALIVASSDLSHYPQAKDAAAVDKETLDGITTLDPELLHATIQAQMKKRISRLDTCACGEAPIMAAMTAAKFLGATRGVVVSYANSGDSPIMSDRSRVVGYGAVVLAKEEGDIKSGAQNQLSAAADEAALRPADKKALLGLARETISRLLLTETVPLIRGFPPRLEKPQGVFVTLRKKDELRGCIGRIIADEPLCKLVGAMAIQAAFNDSRFPPLTEEELQDVEIEISVLTPLKRIADAGNIVVERDGVLLSKKGHSSVFLPQVAPEQGWGREELLHNLCLKAGLKAGCWRQDSQLFTFQATVFSEARFK